MIRILIGLVLLSLLLALLDRLGLWMERRGWIYWRKRRAKGTLASTLLELQKIFESGKADHVIQVQKDGRKEAPDPGGGKPGAGKE
jgi:hypothetical protein